MINFKKTYQNIVISLKTACQLLHYQEENLNIMIKKILREQLKIDNFNYNEIKVKLFQLIEVKNNS